MSSKVRKCGVCHTSFANRRKDQKEDGSECKRTSYLHCGLPDFASRWATKVPIGFHTNSNTGTRNNHSTTSCNETSTRKRRTRRSHPTPTAPGVMKGNDHHAATDASSSHAESVDKDGLARTWRKLDTRLALVILSHLACNTNTLDVSHL